MAGYSGTPLLKKLGIKEGFVLQTYHEPSNYWDDLGPLPDNAQVSSENQSNEVDSIHYFCKSADTLRAEILQLKSLLKKTGQLWISWPKKSSNVPTDLSDRIVRHTGLEAGLVDVKVCAIDDIWSALKFVYRLTNR
ncbi:hypothetical protein AWW68_08675 [Roseivirga spongicola]|uniref:DUF3052 domain-containing protein n=1 Tax=Roseivirga spongicola TaxID=333140 RepID=A0A150XB00_9BACT|nr:DUF3052 family protein [Roseivirga spongicola]KYG75893.1 hypothetical protein AWW68_08675 [Roseivirga spongicola]